VTLSGRRKDDEVTVKDHNCKGDEVLCIKCARQFSLKEMVSHIANCQGKVKKKVNPITHLPMFIIKQEPEDDVVNLSSSSENSPQKKSLRSLSLSLSLREALASSPSPPSSWSSSWSSSLSSSLLPNCIHIYRRSCEAKQSPQQQQQKSKKFRQQPFFGICNRPTQQQQQHRYLFAYQKTFIVQFSFVSIPFWFVLLVLPETVNSQELCEWSTCFCLCVCLFVCLFFFCSCCFETRFLVCSIFFVCLCLEQKFF
jgi:hypothetical protein